MHIKRHCDLCENQILSLKEGAVCGLTNKKPSFNKTCLKINFDEKLKTSLENLHVDLEKEKNKKHQIISSLIINLILGIVVIIGGYIFWKGILDNGFITYFPAIMISAGIYLLRKPFTEIKRFNKVIRNNKKEILKIQDVLSLYNISYKTDIKLLKEVHGTQEYSFDIEIIS